MKNVLYIEKCKLFPLLIKNILEPKGFTVISAKTGNEALEILESSEIDFILSAFELGDMTAEDLLVELKESEFSDIPIILITSYDNVKNVKSFFRLGIRDYILKQNLKDHETQSNLIKDLLR